MKMFKTDEEAVSPVIGVILMVAIVVILAAVIAAFVFGMAGGTGTAKNIGMTVQVDSTGVASLTLQGGADLPQLTGMQYSLNGTSNWMTINTTNAQLGSKATANDFKVGSVLYAYGPATNSRLMIKGIFTDGSEQVVFDRRY